MIPFKSFGTVSYSHPVATMPVSSAVSTRYTNVTDTQPATARRLMHNVARQKSDSPGERMNAPALFVRGQCTQNVDNNTGAWMSRSTLLVRIRIEDRAELTTDNLPKTFFPRR